MLGSISITGLKCRQYPHDLDLVFALFVTTIKLRRGSLRFKGGIHQSFRARHITKVGFNAAFLDGAVPSCPVRRDLGRLDDWINNPTHDRPLICRLQTQIPANLWMLSTNPV